MLQNADYTTNYCKSIGTKQSGQSYSELVIDLGDRAFYGGFSIHSDSNTNGTNPFTRTLEVDGSFSTREVYMQDPTDSSREVKLSYSNEGLQLSSANSSVLIVPRSRADYDGKLTQAQMSTANTMATKGDLDALKNELSMKKDQAIAFLEILKYVPEMASKQQQIENLITSLENS